MDVPDGTQLLSPREREVIRLAGLGLSVNASAAHLGVARSTIKLYRRNACFKLGVSNIAAAVQRVAEEGSE